MHWCKVMERKAYVALTKVYTSSLGKLYERDIKQFMEEAKNRVVASKCGAEGGKITEINCGQYLNRIYFH